MKIESIKPGVAPKKAIEEKNVTAPETFDEISSPFGFDEMDADMQRKLRILRKADPELYRKMTNLD